MLRGIFKGKALGSLGEDRAEEFLKKRGYRILERNYRCPFGEVDIVAEEGGSVVFIEVKTRKSLRFGFPKEAVDRNKMRKLSKVASFYLEEKGLVDRAARFDVVSILFSEGREEIEVLPDAFDLSLP